MAIILLFGLPLAATRELRGRRMALACLMAWQLFFSLPVFPLLGPLAGSLMALPFFITRSAAGLRLGRARLLALSSYLAFVTLLASVAASLIVAPLLYW